jgi:SAM-dependent methyltransferase
MDSIDGHCNICGEETDFYYSDPALYREQLTCGACRSTSRYRSIAQGLLRAIDELRGVKAPSLAALAKAVPPAGRQPLRIYDTQAPFWYEVTAYPIPRLLAACPWIDLHLSLYEPAKKRGATIRRGVTNQNLEALTFPDRHFDVVVTSDVMEHVRLDGRAHVEIRRILDEGGVYLFTVPHFRDRETLHRVAVVDESDPEKDVYLTEREFHGDANSPDGRALSYRSYGPDLDATLNTLGFTVDYTMADLPALGLLNTELFYCRVEKGSNTGSDGNPRSVILTSCP